jgi:hypothetical protein
MPVPHKGPAYDEPIYLRYDLRRRLQVAACGFTFMDGEFAVKVRANRTSSGELREVPMILDTGSLILCRVCVLLHCFLLPSRGEAFYGGDRALYKS